MSSRGLPPELTSFVQLHLRPRQVVWSPLAKWAVPAMDGAGGGIRSTSGSAGIPGGHADHPKFVTHVLLAHQMNGEAACLSRIVSLAYGSLPLWVYPIEIIALYVHWVHVCTHQPMVNLHRVTVWRRTFSI